MSSIVFTEAAATKVFELIQEEKNFALKLRVYVTGGGCSGLQYGFTFDQEIAPDDTVIIKAIEYDEPDSNEKKQADVYLLVDPLSYPYLQNAEIDYQQDLTGEQFIIRNPNAKTTCGCGSSFTVE